MNASRVIVRTPRLVLPTALLLMLFSQASAQVDPVESGNTGAGAPVYQLKPPRELLESANPNPEVMTASDPAVSAEGLTDSGSTVPRGLTILEGTRKGSTSEAAERPGIEQTSGTVAVPPARSVRPAAQPAAAQVTDQPAAADAGSTEAGAAPAPVENPLSKLEAALKDQLKQLENQTDVDETVLTESRKRCQQGLDTIQLAREASRRIAEFKAESENAPQTVEALKKELEAAVAESVVELPAEASLTDLEQQLAQIEAQAAEEKRKLEKLDDDAKKRAERRAKIPRLTESVEQQSADLEAAIAAEPEGEDPLVKSARLFELEARRELLKLQLPFYEAELHRYQALDEVYTLTRDKQVRESRRLEKLAAAWRETVTEFRKAEAERKALEARQKVANAHPALKELAEANAVLAEQRVQLSETIESTTRSIAAVTEDLERIETEYQDVLEKEKAAGLTTAIGLMLRSQREELPDLRPLHSSLANVESEIPRVQLEIMKLRDERDALTDIDSVQELICNQLDISPSQQSRVDVPQLVHEMLQSKRTYVVDLLKDYEAYLKHLGDLDFSTRKLIQQTSEFEAYIDENVLWIRSTDVLQVRDLSDAVAALAYFTSWTNYANFFAGVASVGRGRPVETAVITFLLLLVLLYRQQIGRHLRILGEASVSQSNDSFVPTMKAIGLTLVSASLWPAVIGFFAWRLLSLPDADQFTLSVAVALRATAVVLWTFSFLRQLCRSGGVAEAHFNWPPSALRTLHAQLSWSGLLGLPIVFLVVLIDAHQVMSWNDSLGRILYIAGMGLLTVFLARVLHPRQGVLAHLRHEQSGWIGRLSMLWYLIAVALPVTFAGLAFIGYFFTVERLTGHLVTTAWLAIGLLVAQALTTRWFLHLRQRLEVRKAAHEAEVARRQALLDAGESVDETSPEHSDHLFGDFDLAAVTSEVQRLLRGAAAVGFAVGCWMIWANVLPAFGILDRFELWDNAVRVTQTIENADGQPIVQTVDKIVPTTLSHVLLAVLVLGATTFASRNLPGLIEVALLQRLPLDQGGRHAVTTIFRYAMTMVGVILACRMVGITWSSVQWLIAAMTVGLGFGLQEIFANFVSGLILLIERPLRIGDLVTVTGVTGTVSKMHIRATTIVDPDRRELIVPNKKFITDDFVNWTLSDPVTRVVFPVGIAYGSDTVEAYNILMKVASEHPLVMDEPAPSALFTGFGDSTLDFQLRVFIPRRDCYVAVVHELNLAIDREFSKAGIEIAFPQRDLNIRSIEGLDKILPMLGDQRPAAARSAGAEGSSRAA